MGKSPESIASGRLHDEHLIEAARHGDDEAFSLLITKYKRHVFGLVSRFARHNHELDDICQEIFIKAYDRLGTYRREAPFEHWLSRIATNTCYDALKKAKRDKANIPIEDLPYDPGDSRAAQEDEKRHAYETLMWGLARLQPDERIVITLLGLEEKSVKEVAELTGWNEGNIRVRAHRARQALKKILEAHHES